MPDPPAISHGTILWGKEGFGPAVAVTRLSLGSALQPLTSSLCSAPGWGLQSGSTKCPRGLARLSPVSRGLDADCMGGDRARVVEGGLGGRRYPCCWCFRMGLWLSREMRLCFCLV
jgi:hypothetical protein